MEPVKQRFTIHLEYEMTVDPETGEVLSTELIKKYSEQNPTKPTSSPKAVKPKKGESPDPQLTLEDNKYCLNTAAATLLGVEPGDKLDIKYEKRSWGMQPVIGTDEAFGTKGGNQLTKSNTVACRGSKHDELVKYGDVFDIKPHETKEGLFLLVGDHPVAVEEPESDEKVTADNIDEELPMDVDLSGLVDDVEDTKVEEIDSSYFQL